MESSVPQPTPWWRTAVVYQVYLRSFADGNGDGQGDIAGLRSRLDHLVDLGIDAIWLNPWYRSPLHDGGYDVADYRAIEPRYGTLMEAEGLIADCHSRGIKVIADLVPNHTSIEHEWFVEALAAPPDDPARDRYYFRPGRGEHGDQPPNNWIAVFGGPAWERVDDGDWYLHLFDISQPDLNWDHPDVAAEFESIIRFWLDRGVDGLRIDVAHGLVKHPDLPDVDPLPVSFSMVGLDEPVDHPFWDRDGIHAINRTWRTILDEYDERMMVAEAWVHEDRLPLYLRPDEYHQSFNFDLLETPWEADAWRRVIGEALRSSESIGAGCTWVLSNHDVMRHATRYGLPDDVDWRRWPADGPHDLLDVELGETRARAAALLSLSLPGSTYVYQGEELGLPEVWDLPVEVLDDPTWERSGHTEKGRDGCRVPLPWTRTGPSLGFGDTTAWLPQPDAYAQYSVETQTGDADSFLALYRRTIALRRELLAAEPGCRLLDYGPGMVAYARGRITVAANMGTRSVPLPPGQVVHHSAVGRITDELPPDHCVWMLT